MIQQKELIKRSKESLIKVEEEDRQKIKRTWRRGTANKSEWINTRHARNFRTKKYKTI